jgi:hypothetical protein
MTSRVFIPTTFMAFSPSEKKFSQIEDLSFDLNRKGRNLTSPRHVLGPPEFSYVKLS